MFSFGGRMGKVIVVTNLNDDGPGSFREACETAGPRTIVFNVACQTHGKPKTDSIERCCRLNPRPGR